MKFWDASALVALVGAEDRSEDVVALHRGDPEIMVWGLTIVEAEAALARRQREGRGTREALQNARGYLADLEATWVEVVAVETVRARARRLVGVHPLSSGDALQLAAALEACDDQPRGRAFVTLDRQLAVAAEKEGFRILP